MIVFPNCKINLGLSVVNKRVDGYHYLETIFYPLELTDALEILPAPNPSTPDHYPEGAPVHLTTSGEPVGGNRLDNLCLKAYDLLKKEFPELPPVQMHLHKEIPMGAGLGGGSSDGAFVLKLLNTLFNLGLSTTTLISYALQLGSDCPFFILNRPCFATGRGEIMEPVSLDLSAYKFVLVNCGITINTGWAFTELAAARKNKDKTPREQLTDLIMRPIDSWKHALVNDFEDPVFNKYPAIHSIKKQLYKSGALYASMSGSGSTVFGIFDKAAKPEADFASGCRIIVI